MIDILLATYNGSKYINEQIDSLLSQTFQEWTLIVHDDGSKDDTVQILNDYHKKYPNKIRVIDDGIQCGGAKENFSHLMSYSSAPYIMFCDQDDIWLPNKIEITYNEMVSVEIRNPKVPILIHSDLKVVDENLNVISDSMFDYQKLPKNIGSINQILVQNNITGCTVMINREALSVSLPIPKVAIMHDWWIGCNVLKAKGIIGLISEPLILYRQHTNNTLGSKKIDVSYYISKLNNVNGIVSSYISIWRQAIEINSDVKVCYLFLYKLFFLIKRLFGVA